MEAPMWEEEKTSDNEKGTKFKLATEGFSVMF
jgi:hypothetical protein